MSGSAKTVDKTSSKELGVWKCTCGDLPVTSVSKFDFDNLQYKFNLLNKKQILNDTLQAQVTELSEKQVHLLIGKDSDSRIIKGLERQLELTQKHQNETFRKLESEMIKNHELNLQLTALKNQLKSNES